MNIKRRIYDALNVMISLGYVKKDRKRLALNKYSKGLSPKVNEAMRCSAKELVGTVEKLKSTLNQKTLIYKSL